MPHWLIKSALQRTISWLPASHFWNGLFQQYVTRSLDLSPERFQMRLDHCRTHLAHFFEAHADRPPNPAVLELGTGWYPVIPIGLYLCGAREVWTFDIAPLLRASRLEQVFRRFLEWESTGALQKALPLLQPVRVAKLRELASSLADRTPEQMLEQLNIHAQVRDAQDTGLKPETVDLVVSSAVLEYIPVPVLKNILAESKRVGSRKAIQSHYLNLIDQYWYFDRSITPFNFLRFSAKRWNWFNSPLSWLNRLRISDYRKLFADVGLQITKELATSGSPEELQQVPLAPEFQTYSREDLLVLTAWVVAKCAP